MIKLNTEDQNIFFTSDPHYGHFNICSWTSDWEDKSRCRNFDSLDKMNQHLIDMINDQVKENDILFCLGDWAMGGRNKEQNIYEFREALNCNNIHLILGNHDNMIKNDEKLQALFNSVQHYKEIQIDSQLIVLCHYAMRVWNNAHKGSWMLYGHSHGTLDDNKPTFPEPTWVGDQYFIKNSKSMDVGVDTRGDLSPYSFEEIKEIMDGVEMKFNVDHHTKNDN